MTEPVIKGTEEAFEDDIKGQWKYLVWFFAGIFIGALAVHFLH